MAVAEPVEVCAGLAAQGETSRRVETPASTLSPDLRARTKTTTRLPDLSRKVGRIWKSIVAQPSPPVCTSDSLDRRSNGTPTPYTSAPLTHRPLVDTTWKR